jgi:hypothetical protein
MMGNQLAVIEAGEQIQVIGQLDHPSQMQDRQHGGRG